MNLTLRQVRALVRGHVEVEAEDEVRMLGAMRLAYHGSREEFDAAVERRLASLPPDDTPDDDDGLDDIAAAWGLRIVER